MKNNEDKSSNKENIPELYSPFLLSSKNDEEILGREDNIEIGEFLDD